MLYDCPECGEAYAADAGTVTLCPNCDAENMATFEKPIGSPRSRRMGAWAAGIAAAAVVLVVAAAGWSTFDADQDGLSSYSEMQHGTRPFDGDSDKDGIADGWELSHGLDPMAADSDGDGVADLKELTAAADPQQALCDAVSTLLGECPDLPDAALDAADPEPPRSAAGGKTATALFGGASSLAAGVIGRLVGTLILRR